MVIGDGASLLIASSPGSHLCGPFSCCLAAL